METEISKALAALKANPPASQTPWTAVGWLMFDAHSKAFAECWSTDSAACIAAAVNAAPVLAAEVERLQGLLAAARVAVEALPTYREDHIRMQLDIDDIIEINAAVKAVRRAVGLEGSHG